MGKAEEDGVSSSESGIKNRRYRVTDDIDSHSKKNRKKRRDKCREEENNRKKADKFQVTKSDRSKKKWSPRSPGIPSYCTEKNALEDKNTSENKRKTKEFSKDEFVSSDRLTEDEIDGFSFDFSEKNLTSDEDNTEESEHLDHGESEIRDDFLSLTKR